MCLKRRLWAGTAVTCNRSVSLKYTDCNTNFSRTMIYLIISSYLANGISGWSFKCYRKYYVYIEGAQILVASATKFFMVVPNIFSIIVAVFFSPQIQKSVSVQCTKQKMLANRLTGYFRIVGPLHGTCVTLLFWRLEF